jgi:asparagine synthetase B (glutamine-hydrolysing)
VCSAAGSSLKLKPRKIMKQLSEKAATADVGYAFSADTLRLDGAAAVHSITEGIRDQVLRRLRRRGAVIGLSGGIDSSVTAALSVAALGPDNVLAVLMPEKDSDPESLRLGRLVADTYGIRHVVEDIAPTLSAAGCYLRRDGGDPRGVSRLWSRLELQGCSVERAARQSL